MRCNQCDDAPCMTICPTSALYRADNGVVDFDDDRLHRLQVVHERLPVRRDLHQPRDQHGAQVQLLQPPGRGGAGAGVRQWCARPRRSRSATSTTPTRRSRRIVARDDVAVRAPGAGHESQGLLPGRRPGLARPDPHAIANDGMIWADTRPTTRPSPRCRCTTTPDHGRRGPHDLHHRTPDDVEVEGLGLPGDQGDRRRGHAGRRAAAW